MKNAKLIDIILFSLFITLSVIALYESIYRGIAQSYWLFMLSFAILVVYNVRKMNKKKEEAAAKPQQGSKKRKRK